VAGAEDHAWVADRDLVVVGVVWVPAAFLSLAGSEQAFPEGLAEVGAASDQDEVWSDRQPSRFCDSDAACPG